MKNFNELRETIKKGDVFTKKEALKYFKKERKDFKPSELVTFKNKGGKVVNHWQDKETGEVVPMKESIEEGYHKKKKKYDEDCGMDHSTMKKNKLKKHMDDHHEEKEIEEGVSLSKKGEYDLTVDGKSSVGIRLSLRFNRKQIVTGSKVDGKFVMAFDPKFVKDNKLDSGAKIVKKGKWTHVAFKKADDVIAYAVLGGLSEETKTKSFKEFTK